MSKSTKPTKSTRSIKSTRSTRSTAKPVGKLDLNKETLRSLVDLSNVRGGEQQVADNVVSRNNAMAGSASWFLCCCRGNAA